MLETARVEYAFEWTFFVGYSSFRANKQAFLKFASLPGLEFHCKIGRICRRQGTYDDCRMLFLFMTQSLAGSRLPGDSMTKTYEKSLKELILETISTISDQYLCQLVLDTYGRYEYHAGIARKNHVFFRNSHYVLSFLIPIYSAFFTYIVSDNLLNSPSTLGAIGLLLTILTIVASILKPYDRCIVAGNILIILSNWKTDFMIGLAGAQTEMNETQKGSLYDFLKRKDQDLSKIGESMMENLILKSSVNLQQNEEKKSAAPAK